MKSIVLLALVFCANSGQFVLATQSNLRDWIQYKRLHGKVYATSEEDSLRFSLFLEAKAKIREHNENQMASFKLGLNQFSDWTRDELTILNGLDLLNITQYHNQYSLSTSDEHKFLRSILDDPSPLPEEVDWRKVAGRVADVRDELKQKYCHSEYAIASAEVLEGQLLVQQPNRTELVSLSAQQVIDCSKSNQPGCGGGNVLLALNDIARMGGIMSEQDYPYVAKLNGCSFSKDKVVLNYRGAMLLPPGNDAILKKVVSIFGPVATYITEGDLFESYKSGIYDDPTCDKLPFAGRYVLAVGYGIDRTHGEYWIMKNSWGPNWGENGYMRARRGHCKVGLISVIPTFQTFKR